MKRHLFSRSIACFLLVFLCTRTLPAGENFLLINGVTDEVVLELGSQIHEQVSPASTFKIALSLMGYDAGVLKDESTPLWEYQEHHDDYRSLIKVPQAPSSWIKNSIIWYSRILATELGLEQIQNYLDLLEYGNKDMTGGLTKAWLGSSLKISPKEQVNFIQKMVPKKLTIGSDAIEKTKLLLFKEELADGSRLYGKTGLSDSGDEKILWLVGWIEKDDLFFPFAYVLREKEIDRTLMIPKVKQLLANALTP